MYFIYILASVNRILYTGITNDLENRLVEHRTHLSPNSFAAQYRCNQLVYYEEYSEVSEAIGREKQIKGYRRAKKIALVERINPEWRDLVPPGLPGPSLRSG